jgi:hypothetical protein
MVADPLDGATVTGVAVVGVVVAAVPVDAELPVFAEVVVDFEPAEAAVDWPVVLAAVLVLVPPAWAASPANTPVPVSAPASDQRVSFLIRRRPASRPSRLLVFPLPAFAVWLFMASMVAQPPQGHLRSR